MQSDRVHIFGSIWPAQQVVVLYAGFIYTGVVTVLLGVILPRVAAMHHLSDSQSGALLMTQFASSASGALFVRHRYGRTLRGGYLLMSIAAVGVMAGPAWLAVPMIAAFGLGLGMAMTSTSLLVGRICPDSRGAAMSILNFCWSLGATISPIFLGHVPPHFSVPSLCVPIAVVSAAFAFVLLGISRSADPDASGRAGRKIGSHWKTIALFAAIAFLYVGTETAVGGWMTTYAARAVFWNFSRSSLAATCFWGALLVGRGICPLALKVLSEQRLHLLAIAGSLTGIVLLVEAHNALLLLAGAGCAGLMLGPVFPLTISLFLSRAGDSRNSGWVFAVAGFGGAMLPWITGVVSSDFHSLRSGLLVILLVSLIMLFLALQISDRAGEQLESAPA